ncbi:glycosyltransferase [Methylothermus subterraneus]
MSALVAFYLPNLSGGGVQRVVLKIARALAERGYAVDLVVCEPEGELAFLLGGRLHLHVLEPSSGLASRRAVLRADPAMAWLAPRIFFGRRYRSKTLPWLPALAKYLASRRPTVLFAATPFLNIEAVLARRLAKVPVCVVISEHSHFSVGVPKLQRRAQLLVPAMRRAYLQADEIIAVSRGVADDLVHTLGLPSERVKVIYNPVVGAEFSRGVNEPVDHPWFQEKSVPVVVAVGRLARQKDYPTLLCAFARLRQERPARLAILGSGNANQVARLKDLIQSLGIAQDVAFLGFRPNPLPYMARASLLVLSSLWEGLPTVLIEALACGTPVVSTDCPSGPAEILEGGRYGRLVPVGNAGALAQAMKETLDHPPDPQKLRERAAAFDEKRAIDAYEAILLGNLGD